MSKGPRIGNRHWRWHLLTGADAARDVGRDAERCGPCLRSGQHNGSGRGGCGAGDPAGDAHRGPDRGGVSTVAALTQGYQLAFWIGVGLVVVVIAFGVSVLKPESQAMEEHD